MSYFSLFRLFKFAAAERKIKDYEITDPFLKLLITSNENAIAWNGHTEDLVDENGQPILDENGEQKVVEYEIENQDDINKYVKDILIQELKDRCNPQKEKNNYVKNIDMKKMRGFIDEGINPEFDEAYNIFLENPTEGTQRYLALINGQKKAVFDTWIEFFAGNDDYQRQPAFIYLFLSKIVNSSTKGHIKPPPSCNPMVVEKMRIALLEHKTKYEGTIQDAVVQRDIKTWDKAKPSRAADGTLIPKETIADLSARLNVEASDIIDFLNWEYIRSGDYVTSYTDALSKHNQEITQKVSVAADGEWILFPKLTATATTYGSSEEIYKASNQEEKEKLDLLDALSQPIGWCTTKQRNGPLYTSWGDFYAFVRNGRAECAIRFAGDQLVEFAGDQSTGQYYVCPTKNWREIIKIVEEKGWEGKIAKTGQGLPFWEQILKEKNLNADFFNADGTPNMEEINNFIGFIEKDPRNYGRVNIASFASFPDVLELFKNACRNGWIKELGEKNVDGSTSSIENLLKWSRDIPQFLQEEQVFIDGIHGKVSQLYVTNPLRLAEVHRYLPNHLSLYPQGKDLFKNAVLSKYQEGYAWLNKAAKKYQSPENKIRIERAGLFMTQLSSVIQTCYPDLLLDGAFNAAIEQTNMAAIPDLIQKGFLIKGMPKEQVDEAFANDEFVNNFIEETINRAQQLPNEIKGFGAKKIFNKKFLQLFITSRIPKKFQKNPTIRAAVQTIEFNILNKYIEQYKDFDPTYKENPQLYEAYKTFIMDKNPYMLFINHGAKYFDEKILSDPEFKEAIRSREVTNVDIAKIVRSVTVNPASYLAIAKTDPSAALEPQVIEAYISRRIRIPNQLQKQPIIFEYKDLPQSVKENEEVKKTYQDIVAYLLTAAMPGTKFYIDCATLDPAALEDERIVAGCEKRKQVKKRASGTWYKKSINSLWGYVVP